MWAIDVPSVCMRKYIEVFEEWTVFPFWKCMCHVINANSIHRWELYSSCYGITLFDYQNLMNLKKLKIKFKQLKIHNYNKNIFVNELETLKKISTFHLVLNVFFPQKWISRWYTIIPGTFNYLEMESLLPFMIPIPHCQNILNFISADWKSTQYSKSLSFWL